MEVKVEDVEKRILQTNEKVFEALGNLQKERQNLNNEFEDLQVQYNKNMEEKIAKISELEGKIELLTNEMKTSPICMAKHDCFG